MAVCPGVAASRARSVSSRVKNQMVPVSASRKAVIGWL